MSTCDSTSKPNVWENYDPSNHWVPTPYKVYCQVQKHKVKSPRPHGGQTAICSARASTGILQRYAHRASWLGRRGKKWVGKAPWRGMPEPSLQGWIEIDQKSPREHPSRRKACKWEAVPFGEVPLGSRWFRGGCRWQEVTESHKPHEPPFRKTTLVFRSYWRLLSKEVTKFSLHFS